MHRTTSRGRVGVRIGVAVLAATLMLGTVSSASARTVAQKAKPDEGAVLKLGEVLDAPVSRPIFDPIAAANANKYLFYVYDSLLRQNRDGSYSPALAESATVIDPSTIQVKLKPNLRFQDGTAMDAEAVKFSILRNKDSKNSAAMRPQLQSVSSIDVVSPTELTIHLAAPIAGAWYNLLAQIETTPVSPTAVRAGIDLKETPVGAGPFKLMSKSDQLIRLDKWAGYPDAKKVHFNAIEIVNVSSGEAAVNAYRTGAVDFDAHVTYTQLQQLNGAPVKTDLGIAANPGYDWIALQCKANPSTVGDLRVRKALIYATDREAINRVVYGGEGQVQTQLVSKASPMYDPKLEDLYAYKPKKAKALLADAGMSDLRISMVQPSTAFPQLGQIAEMLQQQWAKAGITLELVPTIQTVQDFYINGKMAALAVPSSNTLWWTDKFTRVFTSESIGGTCNPTDATFTADLAKLQGLDATSPEAAKLFQGLTRILLKDARFVPLVLPPNVVVWNKRLGGLTLRPTALGNLTPDFFGTYITKGS